MTWTSSSSVAAFSVSGVVEVGQREEELRPQLAPRQIFFVIAGSHLSLREDLSALSAGASTRKPFVMRSVMLLRREVPADAVRVTANLPLDYTAAGLADATVAVDVTIGNALRFGVLLVD